MSFSGKDLPTEISPRAVVHQEGVVGLLAVVGLGLLPSGPLAALAPTRGWLLALGVGLAAGGVLSLLLWLLRNITAVGELENRLRQWIGGWGVADGMAVALISGITEEALFRCVIQDLFGLIPAALLFALLHAFPDRRLWFWPLMALAAGLLFGLLQQHFGYPAAAAAHVALNAVSLTRLCQASPQESDQKVSGDSE